MIYRLNRFFNAKSGRALDVAVDHGFFGEFSYIKGIENMEKTVQTLVDANPDAIQLTLGQAKLLQRIQGKTKPALVLRTDVANVYGNPLDSHIFSHHVPHIVEEAMRLDAAVLCVNLLQLPNRPEIREASIRSIMAIRKEATRYNIPMMVEPLVMQDNAVAGGYMVDGDADKIVTLVRQAVELGADLIKADPTDNPDDYHRVIEVAGDIPVLVRGGGKVPDIEILQRTEKLLAQGARGIVYGRNVIQHHDPAGITKALMAQLHDNASVDEALKFIKEA